MSGMDTSMHQYICTERAPEHPGVAIVRLNRPARANAILPEMARELHEAVRAASGDDSVRAIVLTGSGKHFCPGMDGEHAMAMVDAIAHGAPPAEPYDGNLRHLHAATLALHRCSKPVIAALNGSAAAGGLDLALACDCRLATGAAMFAQSYAKLALPPLNGSAWLLPRAVGYSRALRMLLTGERIGAQEALAAGLIDEIVDAETLLPHAVALAASMSKAPPSLVGFIKEELKTSPSLESALSRAYVEGIASVASEPCRQAIEQLRRQTAS